MSLILTTVLLYFYIGVVLGAGHTSKNFINYQCLPNNVMAVSTQSDMEIDINQVQATICGQKRTCLVSTGECKNKGQYMTSITVSNGVQSTGCCQYFPPVDKHKQDQCNVITIQGDANGQQSVNPPRPPSKPNTNSKSTNGNSQKGSLVYIELKNTPHGQDQQLVKSIKPVKQTAGDHSAQMYTVTVCRPVCEGSSTQKPTTPQTPPTKPPTENENPEPPKRRLFGQGGPKCFSGDMMVNTPKGQKRMDEIRAGEEVLVSSIDSKPIYTRVEWLYHKDPEMQADFISISTKSQKTIRLSPNHLIPVVSCNTTDFQKMGLAHFTNSHSIFAGRLKMGDCIATLVNNELIADKVISMKTETKKGIFSPITSHGTIIVNDIYASCFSSFENHMLQQSVHSILINIRNRMAKMWSGVFGENVLAPEDKGIPLPLQMLLKMAQFMLPANVFTV